MKAFQEKKRGGASMFIVVFSIIILSIITLAFTRLMISEATKTTNNDLSQSAYDSALAGVEDAKIAITRYHDCLARGYVAGTGYCGEIIKHMTEGMKNQDCSTVKNVLTREANESTENAVVIQETQNSSDTGNNANMLQSYTCVTIQENLEDYRTTLDSNNRMRVIPITGFTESGDAYIKIRWFSQANAVKAHSDAGHSIKFCPEYFYRAGSCDGDQQMPTTLSVRLIQADEEFNLSELSVSKASNQTDTGMLYFVPDKNAATNSVPVAEWGNSANKGMNEPYRIKCNEDNDWMCYAEITLPKTFKNSNKRNTNATFLILSLPYGEPETDVSLAMYKTSEFNESERFIFTSLQARVDSTGRANDLYRRVEARIDLTDTTFPYPEFELNLTGGEDSTLKKLFWVTMNCWVANNGTVSGCAGDANNGESENLSNF